VQLSAINVSAIRCSVAATACSPSSHSRLALVELCLPGRRRLRRVFSRTVGGWSIADHMRAELVVDALEMARWRRRPPAGAVVHSDRGSQYTSRIFGHRLRAAGLPGSMGRVASSVDNGLMESFWSTMQRELLDRRTWTARAELGSAIFEWIETFYNPRRRRSALGYLSPVQFEQLHTAALIAA
jgi:putative transposase